MVKIVQWGAIAPREPIPSGLEAECGKCHSILETEEEENASPVVKTFRGDKKMPGWVIECPVCGTNVFFRKEWPPKSTGDPFPKSSFSLSDPPSFS